MLRTHILPQATAAWQSNNCVLYRNNERFCRKSNLFLKYHVCRAVELKRTTEEGAKNLLTIVIGTVEKKGDHISIFIEPI